MKSEFSARNHPIIAEKLLKRWLSPVVCVVSAFVRQLLPRRIEVDKPHTAELRFGLKKLLSPNCELPEISLNDATS